MEMLELLKKHYHWQKIKVINEESIETEQGRKRLRFWTDKELLGWHIEWRDNCGVTPYVLADRMIRSKEQDAALSWKDGWLTVHDEVDKPSFVKEWAQEIGVMIGAMIQYGTVTNCRVQPVFESGPVFRQLYEHLSQFSTQQRLLLTSLLHEAETRMKKADALHERLKDETLPLLDPIKSVDQAKQVYQVLIWSGTMDPPERGFRALHSFLDYWLGRFGKEALDKLLDGMYSNERVTREQAILLLTECLKSYELDELVTLMARNPSEQEIEQILLEAIRKWERSKQLVQVISASIDKKKKVLTP